MNILLEDKPSKRYNKGKYSRYLEWSRHKIELLTPEAEKPYIKGEKPLIKKNREPMAKLF